ncbi:DUF6702 family protein [Galbibacter sp.]|uniref:DUF6702 family protein n=1 Tax=Galbibacter sp. TaxID=2918471 RepID=UPI003A93C6CF
MTLTFTSNSTLNWFCKHKYLLLVFLIPLLSFTAYHKFYLSVTDVNYREKDQAIQMISRYFVDDMEKLLVERYGIEPRLMSDEELEDVDSYIEHYLRDKFIIFIDQKRVEWNFIGKQYDVDVMKIYLEVPRIAKDTFHSIGVKSTVLYGVYPEQKNVIHIKVDELKKSYVLIKESDKAVLELED